MPDANAEIVVAFRDLILPVISIPVSSSVWEFSDPGMPANAAGYLYRVYETLVALDRISVHFNELNRKIIKIRVGIESIGRLFPFTDMNRIRAKQDLVDAY